MIAIDELKKALEFSKESGIKIEDVWEYLQERIEELDENNYVYEFQPLGDWCQLNNYGIYQ